MYGGGPDKDAADAKASKLGLDMPFHGPIDHAELGGTHKVSAVDQWISGFDSPFTDCGVFFPNQIFINPSTSEVLCTTVAEALAMGKFVILPSHPSNDFFAQFPNCLPYATKEEFVGEFTMFTDPCFSLAHFLSHFLSFSLSLQAIYTTR